MLQGILEYFSIMNAKITYILLLYLNNWWIIYLNIGILTVKTEKNYATF